MQYLYVTCAAFSVLLVGILTLLCRFWYDIWCYERKRARVRVAEDIGQEYQTVSNQIDIAVNLETSSIDELVGLLPRCRKIDEGCKKHLPGDYFVPLEWKAAWIIDFLNKRRVVGDFHLVWAKIQELYGGQLTQDSDWQELLPVCRDLDSRLKEIGQQDPKIKPLVFSLERLVLSLTRSKLTR